MNYYERRRLGSALVSKLEKAGADERTIEKAVLQTYGLSKKFVKECLFG